MTQKKASAHLLKSAPPLGVIFDARLGLRLSVRACLVSIEAISMLYPFVLSDYSGRQDGTT